VRGGQVLEHVAEEERQPHAASVERAAVDAADARRPGAGEFVGQVRERLHRGVRQRCPPEQGGVERCTLDAHEVELRIRRRMRAERGPGAEERGAHAEAEFRDHVARAGGPARSSGCERGGSPRAGTPAHAPGAACERRIARGGKAVAAQEHVLSLGPRARARGIRVAVRPRHERAV
jgi:hypothetical protein